MPQNDSKPKVNLLTNTLVYSIGNFGSKILSFLLIPFFSFFLTKEELGTYDLLLTTIFLLVPISTFQISDALYRWLIGNDKNINKRKYIGNAIGLLVFSLGSIISLIYITNIFINVYYIHLFVTMLILSCVYPFYQQILRGIGNIKAYAFSGILHSFFLVLFNVASIFIFDDKIFGILSSSILAYVLVIALLQFKFNVISFQYFQLKWNLEKKEMLIYSLPLMLNALSWWVINASDRYLILKYLSLSENGIYAISSRFPAIVILLNSIFMLAWQDKALSTDESEVVDYQKIFKNFLIFELSLVAFLISISPLLISLVVDEAFESSWRYMIVLYVATIFSALSAFIGAGYLRQKKTNRVFFTSLIGAVFNIFVIILTIENLGLYAPALGSFIGFLVIFIIRFYDMKKEFKLNFKVVIFFFLSVYFLSTILITLFLENSYVNFSMIFISASIFLILNKKLFLKH
ncbi:lipopolysaccharide biosynthesis protein [Nonlabens xylanidelens]|uniref:lipopolysaccharide biosynthesis protein n=1 Tax=Nonlabens xylanidelens TaxID=191564 RepID=UPI000CF421C9|nr:lipopolysaccharide biosynthesis protein [Nonlabens xylanidelens]PQJ20915.1 hypothetical protein BST94_05340 [Nonlabens xylanidelens]